MITDRIYDMIYVIRYDIIYDISLHIYEIHRLNLLISDSNPKSEGVITTVAFENSLSKKFRVILYVCSLLRSVTLE